MPSRDKEPTNTIRFPVWGETWEEIKTLAAAEVERFMLGSDDEVTYAITARCAVTRVSASTGETVFVSREWEGEVEGVIE